MKEKVQTMEIIPAEVARKRTDTALRKNMKIN